LAQAKELRSRLDALDKPRSSHVPAKRAAAWLRALGDTLHSADVPEAKSDLIHAIYERIVVAGPHFIRAYLTPTATAHGLAALLPEVVMSPRQDSSPHSNAACWTTTSRSGEGLAAVDHVQGRLGPGQRCYPDALRRSSG
jgi:hypothetical protein